MVLDSSLLFWANLYKCYWQF